MGPFEMVVAIVGITAVASVVKAKYGQGHGPAGRRGRGERGDLRGDSDLAQENRLLRDEMQGMKERLQVLERLATDDESDARRLDREIEKLRESPRLTAERSNPGRMADDINPGRTAERTNRE